MATLAGVTGQRKLYLLSNKDKAKIRWEAFVKEQRADSGVPSGGLVRSPASVRFQSKLSQAHHSAEIS